MLGLNEEQMGVLTKWYNANTWKASNLFFNCIRDLDRDIMMDQQISDFVANVLAKGRCGE
jgi:hypothetical protein